MLDLTFVIPMDNCVQHLSRCLDQARCCLSHVESGECVVVDLCSTDFTRELLDVEFMDSLRIVRQLEYDWGGPVAQVKPSKAVILVEPTVIYLPSNVERLLMPVVSGQFESVSPLLLDETKAPIFLETAGVPWGENPPYVKTWDGKTRYQPITAGRGMVVMTYDRFVSQAPYPSMVDMDTFAYWFPVDPFKSWHEYRPVRIQKTGEI